MTTKKILIILNFTGLIFSLIWLYKQFEWEPLVTSIGALGILITQIFTGKTDKPKSINMNQKGGNGSTNYQSKGHIKINIKNDKR